MVLPFIDSCTINSEAYQKNNSLPTADEVNLVLAGSTTDFVAMEGIITEFEKVYPNCHITYEYVQDYNKNMPIRLAADSNKIDIFTSSNIQPGHAFYDYALDLYSKSSQYTFTANAFPGLLKNFEYTGTKEGEAKQLYCEPLGGEIRGMFVNNTLLKTLGVSIPKNYTELIAACKTIKEAGYIPLQGNPGSFGQQILYPYICSSIANASNYDEVFKRVNKAEAGISELFRVPYSNLYNLCSNGYYDYKYIEKTYNNFVSGKVSQTDYAYNLLGYAKDDSGTYVPLAEKAKIAFMPQSSTLLSALNKIKDDIHSDEEFSFIPAPMGEDGGYVYLSPSSGLAINKKSDHLDWALEFFNYFFNPEVNKSFAKKQGLIPNIAKATDYVKDTLSVPSERFCHLGQVSFDYVFYNVVNKSLVDLVKVENPEKYDAEGKMHTLDYYLTDTTNATSFESLLAVERGKLTA
jgi:ABC-type glycerol-3-phosphate transport system substrate-binding protein